MVCELLAFAVQGSGFRVQGVKKCPICSKASKSSGHNIYMKCWKSGLELSKAQKWHCGKDKFKLGRLL